MKTTRFILYVLFACITTFSISCKDEEITPVNENDKQTNQTETDSTVYVINYGKYNAGNGEISILDEQNLTIENKQIYAANDQELGSTIESAIIVGNYLYLAGNAGDGIIILDAKTFESVKTINQNITKPRYFAADDKYIYVSCWGEVDSWSDVSNSYIAVIDHTQNTYITKIPLANGAQGLTIANGKLYVALQSRSKIGVIDLSDFSNIKYIETKAVCQQVALDANNNLWVSQVSSYSHPAGADSVGLLHVDTKADTIISFHKYSQLGSNGYIVANKDGSKIYAMGAEAYPSTVSELQVFDIATKSFASTPLLKGESFYGIGYSKNSGYLYVCLAPDLSTNGSLKILNDQGEELAELETSIGPMHILAP